jgi:hypothetical protein
MDRELFVRSIPPEMISTNEILLSRTALPPLRFGRQDLIDAVLEIDLSVDISRPYRLDVMQPGLGLTIAIPAEDPLPMVLLRVARDSDREVVDLFVGRLLTKLDARAFDTGSESLIFTAPG